MFAVGLGLYSGLEVNTPVFALPTRGTLLRSPPLPNRNRLRGCHSLSQGFPAHFGNALWNPWRATHHIRARLAAPHSVCPPPRSVALLTECLLVSFPPPTEIFQFSGCPADSSAIGDLWITGCMRLPTAFRSLLRPSSIPKPSHPLAGTSS